MTTHGRGALLRVASSFAVLLLLASCGESDDGETETFRLITGQAAVNDAELYYEEQGSGEPVILLHGFTLDTRMWDDQFDRLARSFRVIRFDMRGHGRSSGVTGDFSQIEDTRGLLDFLGVRRAHVVGLSMGGTVSYRFAIDHPERVLSLSLLDSGWEYDPDNLGDFYTRLVQYVTTGLTEGLEAGLLAWSRDPLLEPALALPDVRSRLHEMLFGGHLTHGSQAFFLNGLRAAPSNPPAVERLGEISAPALVVVGAQDIPEFLQHSERLARDLPGARSVAIAGGGHLITMEKPAELNAALEGFLRTASR